MGSLAGAHRAQLGRLFDLHNAFDRADSNALRRVVMAFTFHTGSLINDVQDAIALADRLSGALRDARAARNAFFSNSHGHRKLLLLEISHQN
jgi:hypothetical protein